MIDKLRAVDEHDTYDYAYERDVFEAFTELCESAGMGLVEINRRLHRSDDPLNPERLAARGLDPYWYGV